MQGSFLDRVAASFKVRLQVSSVLFLIEYAPASIAFFRSALKAKLKPWLSVCTQAEGLSVHGTEGCRNPSTTNATRNSTLGLTRREACYAQVAEALPRGIIAPTTDLQMRSLFDGDEEQVRTSHVLLEPTADSKWVKRKGPRMSPEVA